MGKIYEQLNIEERTMIQTQLELGIKPAAIAAGLKRSASTLSRELRRNGWTRPKMPRGPGRSLVAGGYRAETTEPKKGSVQECARAIALFGYLGSGQNFSVGAGGPAGRQVVMPRARTVWCPKLLL